jgi:ACS family tartrate transporter-like MFS transporter
VISIATDSLSVSLGGMCVALVGITSARGIFWSIPPRFLSGIGAAGGLALINSLGTMGGFFGPVLMGWLKQRTGSYTPGLLTMALLILLSGALALVVRRLLRSEPVAETANQF